METRELAEAKKLLNNIAIMYSSIVKLKYALIKIPKLNITVFQPVQRATRKIEITTTEFIENKLNIPVGLYFITNFWLYKDDIYDYVFTFVLRTKPNEEVIVYGEGFYTIIGLELENLNPNDLLTVVVYEDEKVFRRDSIEGNAQISNIYKRGGIYVYELHNQVIEFLNSFWWHKCEASGLLEVKNKFGI